MGPGERPQAPLGLGTAQPPRGQGRQAGTEGGEPQARRRDRGDPEAFPPRPEVGPDRHVPGAAPPLPVEGVTSGAGSLPVQGGGSGARSRRGHGGEWRGRGCWAGGRGGRGR